MLLPSYAYGFYPYAGRRSAYGYTVWYIIAGGLGARGPRGVAMIAHAMTRLRPLTLTSRVFDTLAGEAPRIPPGAFQAAQRRRRYRP